MPRRMLAAAALSLYLSASLAAFSIFNELSLLLA